MKSILHLVLNRDSFAKIVKGMKRVEDRAFTPYGRTRLEGRNHDTILFRNGYATKAPGTLVEYRGYRIQSEGRKRQFAVRLGHIPKIKRWKP